MKRILLDATTSFYKANLHCHSTNSDGDFTPQQLKDRYQARGYSIVAFSDHEHLLDNSYLTDDTFLALTACELAIKEFPDHSTLTDRSMKVCHLNLIAKDAANIDTPCYNTVADHFLNDDIRDRIRHSGGDYAREYSAKGISEMIRIANENGFLVVYNHPRWSLENATDYLGYAGLWAVEIYNHAGNVAGMYEYDINVYDDFLRDGQDLACVAGDDNHRPQDMFGGFVMINAEKLDYASVIRAMEEHRLYASTGPIIKELYIEDNVAHLTFEKAVFAAMSTRGRRVDKRMAADPEGENTVEFPISPDDGYIRFDVVDGCGRRANTCAYFV